MIDGTASEPAPVNGRLEPPPRGPGVWILLLLAIAVAAFLFRGLVLPFLVAAFLAYLLNPVLAWAQGQGVRRSVAVAGLYLGIVALATLGWLALGARLRAEATSLAGILPTLVSDVEDAVDVAAEELVGRYPGLKRLVPGREQRQGWLDRLVEQRTKNLAELFEHAGTIMIFVLVVPFFVFFLLRDSGRLIDFLVDRVPPVHIETSVAVWCELNRIVGRYLRGIALDGIVVGILATIGLWALGVSFPIFLGAFAGVANAVPYLGPILAAAAASLVVLTETRSFAGVGPILLLFVSIKLLDDAVIQPLTIGRSVHLHPMLLLASVVAGNQAFGVLGMLAAVPAVTVLQETTRLLIEHRRALRGDYVADDTPPRPVPRYVC